jgi:hypothetical protein
LQDTISLGLLKELKNIGYSGNIGITGVFTFLCGVKNRHIQKPLMELLLFVLGIMTERTISITSKKFVLKKIKLTGS